MENLNAEQINDILDKMEFFQGQRAGRELWNSKPFAVQEQDIANFSRDVALIKNYIKELTEENERLKKDNEYILMQHAFQRRPSGDCWNDVIEKSKADTVRKMSERLKERFSTASRYTKYSGAGVVMVIDQTAKEMLEET